MLKIDAVWQGETQQKNFCQLFQCMSSCSWRLEIAAIHTKSADADYKRKG